MTTTDRDDLVAAVIAARDDIHPELDVEFLIDVVRAEAEAGDDQDTAMRAVEAAVTRALARMGD